MHDSFLVSGGNQGRLNAIWLSHCHRILDEYSNDSDAESEKVRKAKKSKKKQATRSGVVF